MRGRSRGFQCNNFRVGGPNFFRDASGNSLQKSARELLFFQPLTAFISLSHMTKKAESQGALKLKDARTYLGGLSVPTMHRLIKRGLLRPNRSTRHLLFPISELDRFLRDGMTE